jgi:hypothetical protein
MKKQQAPKRLVDMLEQMQIKRPEDKMVAVRKQENAEDLGKSSLMKVGLESVISFYYSSNLIH